MRQKQETPHDTIQGREKLADGPTDGLKKNLVSRIRDQKQRPLLMHQHAAGIRETNPHPSNPFYPTVHSSICPSTARIDKNRKNCP